ncbi:MAG: zinc-ribbon domain containing protein [Patescibacteria group bacterium]
MFQDKTLVCESCGKQFVFTAAEQEFYAQKGFSNEPKRCKECRQARKNEVRGGRGGFGGPRREREMYTTTCSNCGGEAQVPFVPKGDKPVLCENCYKASRNA